MADLQKTINRCKKSISDGEPIYDYKFYYDVIELLAGKKPIEPFKEVQTVGGWTSVEDRMPELEGDYLVTDGQRVPWKCRLLILAGTKGWVNGIHNPIIKYWMPLPEPSKEGETNES